jgi:protein-disulfide isomerase
MTKSFNVVIGVLVGAVAGFAVRGALIHEPLGTAVRQQAPARAAGTLNEAPRPPDQIFQVALGDAPTKGEADAKVTVVEFSDFQCPYCGRVIETLQQLEKSYGRDVRWFFKHNPLPMHPDAPYAAKASIAAGRQGKFWEMHDKLFEANNSHLAGALSRDKVLEMARALQLDLEKFKRDADSPEVADVVVADQAQAQRLGASGTPSFFINGAKITGAQPLEAFKAAIDAQLKRANEVLARGVPRSGLYAALIKDGIAEVPQPPSQPPAAAPPAPPAPQVRNVEPGEGPSLGSKNAKVTIVEWSDFQCPFCGQARPTLQEIERTYKNDVKVVWRNQPLTAIHPNALPAAKAAMAAAKQGKFWEMHDLMFAHQQELSEAKYEEWAKQIGLKVARWKKDKESPQIASAIEKDARYGMQVGADGTPTFFINGKLIAGALPFESFKTVIDEQIAKAKEALKRGVKPNKLYQALVAENLKAAPAPAPAAPAPALAAGQAEAPAKIDIGNAPSLGPKNAPITMVEWSDFQCPYCGRAQPTLQQLRAQYGDKLRLVWKNQPLGLHENAMSAAEAAMAAAEQGKFWEMHDRLFARQNELSPALYDQLATEIGLDLSKFHASIEGHRNQAAIRADMQAGAALGASGTPTFFINGRKLVGAQPVEAFKQIIDSELASAVAKK